MTNKNIKVHASPKTEEVVTEVFEIDEELLDDLRELIHERSTASIANILANLHASEIAVIINHLNTEEGLAVFELLGDETASEVLLELDEKVREDLLELLSHTRLRNIVGELDSDDAADIVGDLPTDIAERVLAGIDKEDSATVKRLLTYPEDSAGGIMATEYVAVNEKDTVQQAIKKVRKKAKEIGEIYNVYIVDESNVLKGIIPVKDLVIHSPRRRVSRVMNTDYQRVDAYVDQEEVANIMKNYDLVSIPVVNENGEMLGKITIDDIVDVIHEEAEEDILRLAGISGTESIAHGTWDISRRRIPWLLAAFVGELLSAVILSRFHASIEQIITAAFFIPIIMAMGGNAGIQSAAVAIRGLATGEILLGMLGKRLLKETSVAIFNGLIFAVLIFAVSALWFQDYRFGLSLGMALLIVIGNATVVGAAIPFILEKLKIDPAVATGPFITTSNDALGLLIYFTVLTLLYL